MARTLLVAASLTVGACGGHNRKVDPVPRYPFISKKVNEDRRIDPQARDIKATENQPLSENEAIHQAPEPPVKNATPKQVHARPDTTTGEDKNHTPSVALRKEQIEAAIIAVKPKIRVCYLRELNKDHSLAGTLETKFAIGTEGEVSEATATGIDNNNLKECVLDILRGIKFSVENGSGGRVHYPFIFRIANAAGDSEAKEYANPEEVENEAVSR